MTIAKTFPERFPNPLAIEFGEDLYGLFQVFEFDSVQATFRWCPPGEFMMGSPEKETGRYGGETQHHVKLTEGFWLAETTVTQAFWEQIMGNNPSRFVESENPVERVSYLDCQEFIERLNNEHPDLKATFPTEAQWEYACRAGTQTAFFFGDEISLDQANYIGEWEGLSSKGKTRPVNSYTPNAWGFWQMHGNVWEWCQDWYDEYPPGALVDPIGPLEEDVKEKSKYAGKAKRVLRGGSWYETSRYARSAHRFGNPPDGRYASVGLRLALGH